MAAITGKTDDQTYKDLLQVSNGNAGIDGTLRPIESGAGVPSALLISTTGVRLLGQLDFANTDHAGIRLNNLTTAQRDALPAAKGMAIFNITTSQQEVYNGTSWVAGGATGPQGSAGPQGSTGAQGPQGPAGTTPSLTNYARLDTAQTYSQQQNAPATTLSDAATIGWDVNTAQSATVTLGGNRTLANPTNLVAGAWYSLEIRQDATGGRTLAYGNLFKFAGGAAPTLATTPNAINMLTAYYNGTVLLAGVAAGFA